MSSADVIDRLQDEEEEDDMDDDDVQSPLLGGDNDARTRRRNPEAASAAVDDLGLTGCAGSYFCHPRAFGHRMIALVLMCLLGFGSYFCFDNPGALQHEIKETMDVTTFQFANLYSWYSWPNVILPIIGGYLMDSVFGIRLGTVIFATFIIAGQIMFAMGGATDSFILMQSGRFVFGIGGESLSVAQNTYAVSWFKGKELNMVFGFQLSIARVGSTVNFLLVGPLFKYLSQYYAPNPALGMTLFIAGTTCIMSFFCAVVLGIMDKRAGRLLKKDSIEGEKIRMWDIFTFPRTFWLVSVVCLAYYVAIFPFISLGQVFFIKKFDFDASQANFITGLIYLISAFASPVLGYLIDKTGRNITYVFTSIVMTLVGHMALAYTFINPYVAVSLMGVSYSLLASSLWPIAALIIPEYQLGTAYGLLQAIQNLGLALITMLSGVVVDQLGYLFLESFFIFWLVVALLATTVIWLIDFYGSGYLNMGIGQRERWEEGERRRKEEQDAEAARLEEAERVRRSLRPRTAQELRNRYLFRVGTFLPPHMGHSSLMTHEAHRQEREQQDEEEESS